jgi:hypothetical protein
MIETISWSMFLSYLGTGILVYYLFAFGFFYKEEIKAKLEGQKIKQNKTSFLNQEKKPSKKEVPLGESYDYGADF